MILRETLTYEHEDGDIFFDILIDTEDGSHEIEWGTVERNFEYYSPSIQEIQIMQEEAEEQARIQCEQYEEERLEGFDDWPVR